MAANRQKLFQTFCMILFSNGLLILAYIVLYRSPNKMSYINNTMEKILKWEVHPFVGFDNITGADHFIVPNIIHFIRFNQTEYSFVDYLCLMAAFRNHRPDHIYIHSNVEDKFHGKYWNWVQKDTALMERIRLVYLPLPIEIFGQNLSDKWHLHHGSDVSRIRILMKYGGIYLDNDVFVNKNLNRYRKFEISVNWDQKRFFGNQIIIAHKDARFLKLYLESYKDNYSPNLWYYNAGERPTKEILYRFPELVHRVEQLLGVDSWISLQLYTNQNFSSWRALDAIHLLINHRFYLDPRYREIPTFDENNIRNYSYPFADMAREIIQYS